MKEIKNRQFLTKIKGFLALTGEVPSLQSAVKLLPSVQPPSGSIDSGGSEITGG